MAFDFVSYIDTALAPQHSSLLPEQISDTRSVYFKHLIAFTLHDFIQRFEHEPDTSYQLLHHQEPELVFSTAQAVVNHIRQHEAAATFFAPIQSELTPLASSVSQRIADELLALEQVSNLGTAGIRELLTAQYQHIQPSVLPWFWQAIGIAAPNTPQEQAVDTQTVMHEFNHMMQQTSHQIDSSSDQQTAQPINSSPSTITHTVNTHTVNPHAVNKTGSKPVSKSSHKKEIYLLLTIILVALSLFLLYQSLS